MLRAWLLRQFRRKPRIYVFPTRMGGYLNGLIFLMFLLSVGYSNNLLLIFTLFLFGLNLIWVIQTHSYLKAFSLRSVQAHDAHAGEFHEVRFHWDRIPSGPSGLTYQLDDDKGSYPVTVLSEETLGRMSFSERGVRRFTHLRVKTDMPFGLYQVWIYLPVKVELHVYPRKLKNFSQIKFARNEKDGGEVGNRSGTHDIWNLRPYQGDEARKISWKHFAKSGELVVKEGEELVEARAHFKLSLGKDKEHELSVLASQMVQCRTQGIPFSFETQEKNLGPGVSEEHLRHCLRELSVC